MGCGNSAERKEKEYMRGETSGNKKGKGKKKKYSTTEEVSPALHEANSFSSPIRESRVPNGRSESVAALPTPVKGSFASTQRTSNVGLDRLLYFGPSEPEEEPSNVVFRAVEVSKTIVPKIPPAPLLQAIESHQTQRVMTPPLRPLHANERRGNIVFNERTLLPLKALEVRATRRHPIPPVRAISAVEIYKPVRPHTPVAAPAGVCEENGTRGLEGDAIARVSPLHAVELCGRKMPPSKMCSTPYLQAVEIHDSKTIPDSVSNSLNSSSSEPLALTVEKEFQSDEERIASLENSSLLELVSLIGETPLDRVVFSGTSPAKKKPYSVPLKQEQLSLYASTESSPHRPRLRQLRSTSVKECEDTGLLNNVKKEPDTVVGAAAVDSETSSFIYLPCETSELNRLPVRRSPSPYSAIYEAPFDEKGNKTPTNKTPYEQPEQEEELKYRHRPPIAPVGRGAVWPVVNGMSEVAPVAEPLTEPRGLEAQFPPQTTTEALLDSGMSVSFSDELGDSEEFLRKSAVANSSGWEVLRQLRLVLQMRETMGRAREGENVEYQVRG